MEQLFSPVDSICSGHGSTNDCPTITQRRQAMLQLHLSEQRFNCLIKCDILET